MNPFALNGQVLFSYELALHKISDILFFVSQKSQWFAYILYLP